MCACLINRLPCLSLSNKENLLKLADGYCRPVLILLGIANIIMIYLIVSTVLNAHEKHEQPLVQTNMSKESRTQPPDKNQHHAEEELTGTYRICIVDGDQKSREALKYCPKLKDTGSKAECIFGNSRLDCLRLIAEDAADFGVFQPEDLVVALNYDSNEFSVTHDIQYFEMKKFDYEVMAVVRKSSNITSLSELRDKNFCHPGFGDDVNWTEIILRFFEARVVPQQCDATLTLEENYINSSSAFFKAACKAGPWVLDSKLDEELKAKYPNLCELCDSPRKCSTLDKYWGQIGSLYCLTDGLGDVAWGRLEDIKQHFGITPGRPSGAKPEDYNFLCDDGSLKPLSEPEGCSWVARPWPAILSRRKSAEAVQKLIASLKKGSSRELVTPSWKMGLQLILHPTPYYVIPLETIAGPEDYLSKAPGFLSANTMHHCDRSLRVCTHTSVENAKCNWLKRAAQVYGVEPLLSCVLLHSKENCLMAVQNNLADAVMVPSDWTTMAQKQYSLKPLLYEINRTPANMVNIAAVVKANSSIYSLADLEGKKACFPHSEGMGWNTVVAILQDNGLLPAVCPYESAIGQFFSEACVPGLNGTETSATNLVSLCEENTYGETGAFQCLAAGKADVAFTKLKTVIDNTDGASNESWAVNLQHDDFRSLCVDPSRNTSCYLSWASPGQVMIHSSFPKVRRKQMYTLFKRISGLFGPSHKSGKPAFKMFGPFNGKRNILFNDFTEEFEDIDGLGYVGRRPRNYEHMMAKLKDCSVFISSSVMWTAKWYTIMVAIVCLLLV